ncbi:MAG: hypothetical protein H7Z41_07445, partial [Cytophagales bacterium]|nr:hypothetical protein [Armatimonadota bacterium]
MTRIRARRQTAIAGVLLGSACLSAPSPPRACGQATPPPDTTGFAALDLQDTLVVADASGSEPPRIVPIKNTNYPVPVGALFVSPLGRAENPGSQATPTTLEKVVGVLKQSKRLSDSKKIVSGTPPGEHFAATGSVFRNN